MKSKSTRQNKRLLTNIPRINEHLLEIDEVDPDITYAAFNKEKALEFATKLKGAEKEMKTKSKTPRPNSELNAADKLATDARATRSQIKSGTAVLETPHSLKRKRAQKDKKKELKGPSSEEQEAKKSQNWGEILDGKGLLLVKQEEIWFRDEVRSKIPVKDPQELLLLGTCHFSGSFSQVEYTPGEGFILRCSAAYYSKFPSVGYSIDAIKAMHFCAREYSGYHKDLDVETPISVEVLKSMKLTWIAGRIGEMILPGSSISIPNLDDYFSPAEICNLIDDIADADQDVYGCYNAIGHLIQLEEGQRGNIPPVINYHFMIERYLNSICVGDKGKESIALAIEEYHPGTPRGDFIPSVDDPDSEAEPTDEDDEEEAFGRRVKKQKKEPINTGDKYKTKDTTGGETVVVPFIPTGSKNLLKQQQQAAKNVKGTKQHIKNTDGKKKKKKKIKNHKEEDAAKGADAPKAPVKSEKRKKKEKEKEKEKEKKKKEKEESNIPSTSKGKRKTRFVSRQKFDTVLKQVSQQLKNVTSQYKELAKAQNSILEKIGQQKNQEDDSTASRSMRTKKITGKLNKMKTPKAAAEVPKASKKDESILSVLKKPVVKPSEAEKLVKDLKDRLRNTARAATVASITASKLMNKALRDRIINILQETPASVEETKEDVLDDMLDESDEEETDEEDDSESGEDAAGSDDGLDQVYDDDSEDGDQGSDDDEDSE